MHSTATFPAAPPEDASLGLEEVRALSAPLQGPTGPLPARTRVIIVGAGPAGLTAANLLGKMGVETLLIEAAAATSDQPKAIAIDDEYMRLLVDLDLEEALRGHVSDPFGIWFMGAKGAPIIQVLGAVTSNGFGRRCAVMQPVFEKILLAGALRFEPVCVRYSRRLEAISQSAGAVHVTIDGAEVRGDYLLGCDGTNSFVRKALGIDFVGSRIDEPHIVIDFADFPDDSPYSRFFCNPKRPFNSIPAVYGGRRIEFMLNAGDDPDHILSDQGIRELVEAHTPYRGAALHVIRRSIYGFAARIADRLQDGRVFLLGDAAHVMPPFGGQGMNTAARDANNLCWKIAAALKGRAPDALLATYDVERRPQIRSIVKYSVAIGRFTNIRSAALAASRDAFFNIVQKVPAVRRFFSEMRYMPRPTISSGLVAPAERQYARFVGLPFPRLVPFKGDALVPLDALAGDGFCLVGIDVEPAALRDAAQHRLWRSLPVRLLSLHSHDSLDQPGMETARFEEPISPEIKSMRSTISVVRPDRYVAAMASTSRIDEALEVLAATLAPPNRGAEAAAGPPAKEMEISYDRG